MSGDVGRSHQRRDRHPARDEPLAHHLLRYNRALERPSLRPSPESGLLARTVSDAMPSHPVKQHIDVATPFGNDGAPTGGPLARTQTVVLGATNPARPRTPPR